MAKSTRIPASFTLELTEKEAEFLVRLLGNHIVGGGEWRQVSDSIHASLFRYEELNKRLLPTRRDEESRIFVV